MTQDELDATTDEHQHEWRDAPCVGDERQRAVCSCGAERIDGFGVILPLNQWKRYHREFESIVVL